MQNISSAAKLKNAIQLLEVEQSVKRQELKEQLNYTFQALKPLNLLRNTLKDFTSSPNLIDNVLGSAIGLASGFVSKKIFLGTSGSIIRKFLGSVLQFGVTNAVARHPEAVKSLSHFITQLLSRRKESKTERSAK
jgi:hypothetical protein